MGVEMGHIAGLCAVGARIGRVEVFAIASNPHCMCARVGERTGDKPRHPMVGRGIHYADLVVTKLADVDKLSIAAGHQMMRQRTHCDRSQQRARSAIHHGHPVRAFVRRIDLLRAARLGDADG